MNSTNTNTQPYLLVSGDFTKWGGMDRPNFELAWYLADQRDVPVHLVSYSADVALRQHPNVLWHRVPKPMNRYALASSILSVMAGRIANVLSKQHVRVISNGGICITNDVTWIHAVHAAWNRRDQHAPAGYQMRAALAKASARRSERRATRAAKLVLTNSNRARAQIVDKLRKPKADVKTVYYGIDRKAFVPTAPHLRQEARKQLGWITDQPMVAFIGALGHDRNKGFDVLFDAWTELCQDASWDVGLVAAGAGAEVESWRHRIQQLGLQSRIRMLGFTTQVANVLAASDALVSPTHYDAYGHAVHEAICCGLPAFVTSCAGVAERFPPDLTDFLLDDPPSARDIARRMRHWRRHRNAYQSRIRRFGENLSQRTWTDMAEDIYRLVNSNTRTTQRSAA